MVAALFGFFLTGARGESGEFAASAGVDKTEEDAADFTAGDLTKLSTADDKRIQTNASWPQTGAYDLEKYLEFTFSPNLDSAAVVEKVLITHEFRRSGTLTAAKFIFGDRALPAGEWLTEKTVAVGNTTNTDYGETFDITEYFNTPAKLNKLRARFMAYRNTVTASGTTTSHDLIRLTVDYLISTPTITPSPTSEVTPTPQPTTEVLAGTVSPTPDPTPNVDPIPMPMETQTPSPTPSVVVSLPVYTPSRPAEPIPYPTPIILAQSTAPVPLQTTSATATPVLLAATTVIPSLSPTDLAISSIRAINRATNKNASDFLAQQLAGWPRHPAPEIAPVFDNAGTTTQVAWSASIWLKLFLALLGLSVVTFLAL